MEPTLRCKMRVSEVKHSLNENGETEYEQVTLQAVYGKEGTANNQWSKWTPSANFTITISNPGAFSKLSKGKFYFVDFVPAGLDE